MFSDFLNRMAHLLRWSFDEKKETLNIKITHDLDIENLVYQFNAFDFDVSAAINDFVVFIS